MKTKEEIEQLAEKKFEFSHEQTYQEQNDNIKYRIGFRKGYTQCQQDNADNFLSLIEEYREKELPNRNIAYHYEAEISSGLNFLIEFIKNKQD